MFLGMRVIVMQGSRAAPWVRRVARRAAVAVLAGWALGCASGPTGQEVARLAWENRDVERGRECVRAGGRWISGECNFRCD
jgi:hypothetical protein